MVVQINRGALRNTPPTKGRNVNARESLERLYYALLDRVQNQAYALGSSNARCTVLEAEIKRLQTVQTMAPPPAEVTVFRVDPVILGSLLRAAQSSRKVLTNVIVDQCNLPASVAKTIIDNSYGAGWT